jgi:hypothetical protein
MGKEEVGCLILGSGEVGGIGEFQISYGVPRSGVKAQSDVKRTDGGVLGAGLAWMTGKLQQPGASTSAQLSLRKPSITLQLLSA